MNDDDKKFASLLGAGQLSELNLFMKIQNYKPNWKSLAVALHLGLNRADPKAVNGALSFHGEDVQGRKIHYQFYSKPTTYGSSGWSYGGSSAWLALMASGKGPGDKGFDDCADLLARQEIGLNAYFQAGKIESVRLAHHLCLRGWTHIAPRLEGLAKQRFDASEGGADALALALQGGHGSAALWALSRGGSGGHQSVAQGVRGVLDPLRPQQGGCAEPSWNNQALGLRLGAKISGLAAIDAGSWKHTIADPLSSPKRLLCWLMIRSAWAQSESLGPPARQTALTEALADQKGQNWAKLSDQSEPPAKKGLLSFFSKAVAAAVDTHDGFLARASELVHSREGLSSGALAKVLPWIDKGDFDQAHQVLESIPVELRLRACVELLGLAKTGYWDMPMPCESSFDPNERHPMRWAGFKLALRAWGRGMGGPIPGLLGTTLPGLCATLGFEDAISELIEVGVSLDLDELTQGPSPLWLALRHGHTRLAQGLLDSGASAVEGVKASPFGFPARNWAIHLAFDMRQEKLVENMLKADPRSARLPDLNGFTLLERTFDLAKNGANAELQAFGSKMGSVVERSILSGESRVLPSFRAKSL